MPFHAPAFLSFSHRRPLRHALPETVTAAPQVRHDTPRYDSRTGLFEARVDVTRDGTTFRYPVSVAAPCDADPVWVSQALIRRALGLSDTPRMH